MDQKKTWATPALASYGSVEDLTQQKIVPKTFGAGDDLASVIQNVS